MRLHVLGLIGIGFLAYCTPFQLNVVCIFVSMYACCMVNGICMYIRCRFCKYNRLILFVIIFFVLSLRLKS